MYWFRLWQPAYDLPWLERVEGLAAWESLDPGERALTAPERVAALASQQVRSLTMSPQNTAIIAMDGGQPVGYILIGVGPDTSTDELQGHLFSIWVAAAHRQHGLARQLTALGEEFFRRLSIRKVKIVADSHNAAALRLASSAGYAPEGLIGLRPLV